MRKELLKTRCWVVKIGSSLITNNGLGLDKEAIAAWVEQLVTLQEQGIQVVLVSSGAVAEGVARLGLKTRPKEIHLQQAAAAVGQMGLIQTYESNFAQFGVHTAQILLTHEDLSNRTRYLNARSTLTTLVSMNVIPVINENDTVATAELCFGDNDTLGALVANLVNADALIILTDQKGLHKTDPRKDPSSPVIASAKASDPSLTAMAGSSNNVGRGGMITKVTAAKLAARSGANTIIANGRESNVLVRLAQGEEIGTLLLPDNQPVAARKQWLAGHKPKGQLQLDAGAVQVLKHSGRSLLPVGVVGCLGRFSRGDVVSCLDEQGLEIARGLVNYDSQEVARLQRCSSDKIEALLGYAGEEEMIHRDNLVLID